MSRAEPEVREYLDALLESLPELPEPEVGVIHTPRVLAELARPWPEPLSDDRRRSLESLCRKVHVARQVRAAYRPGWKRRKSAEPLAAAFWPLLIAIFLASAVPAGGAEANRGMALKSLNAALAALDLAPDGSAGELDELRAWSERLLAVSPRRGADGTLADSGDRP